MFDPVLGNSQYHSSLSRPSNPDSQNSPGTKKRKKKKLSLDIPDENASLEGRITQMVDCVGPLSNRHNQRSTGRSGVWGDSNGSLHLSKAEGDSNSDAASSHMQLMLN